MTTLVRDISHTRFYKEVAEEEREKGRTEGRQEGLLEGLQAGRLKQLQELLADGTIEEDVFELKVKALNLR